MAEMRVRQTLDNSQFKKNAKLSESIGRQMGNSLKAVGGMIAGAFAVGFGAVEAFKKVIGSTEALSDSFARTMEGGKQGVNFLARALANLDFTNLIQGFRDAFREGERYADVLDEIEDRERSLGIRKATIEGQILDQKRIAKAAWSTVEEKKAAIEEIIRLTELERDETLKISNDKLDNQLDNAAQTTKGNKDMILDMVSNYDNYIEKINQAKTLEADLNKLILFELDSRGRAHQNLTAYNKALAELTPEQKELLEILNVERNLIGEKRDLIAAAAVENISAVNAQKSGELELQKLRNSLYNEFIKQEEGKVSAIEDEREAIRKLNEESIKKIAGGMNPVTTGTITSSGAISEKDIQLLEAFQAVANTRITGFQVATEDLEELGMAMRTTTEGMSAFTDSYATWAENTIDVNQMMGESFSQLAMNMADSMSNAVATWVAGGDGLKTLFRGMLGAVAQFLKGLGEAMMASGLAAVALKKLSISPGLAIAAGLALQLAAGVVRGIMDQGVKMKEGGIVPSGFPNDTYPAMLTSGETVLPAPIALNQSMGGNDLSGTFRIKGEDLYYIIGKQTSKQNRIR